MRLPNHIILDFVTSKSVKSSEYWAVNVINSVEEKPLFLLNDVITSRVSYSTTGSKLFSNPKFLLTYVNPFKSSLLNNFSIIHTVLPENKYYNPLNNLINVNFIRKERLYTKLKYSRSPAYDIVSGGAAALLAGLLGFLVSEKFGMELVDSGDFYYLFMYMVFIAFSIRPLLEVMDHKHSLLYLVSLKRVIDFYTILTLNILKFFKA